MTQGEVQAFWSGVAATSKGKILARSSGGDGIRIVSVTPIFYASDSDKTPDLPTSEVLVNDITKYSQWNQAIPPYTEKYCYFFTSTQVIYSDNSISWSSAVRDSALESANRTAYTAVSKTAELQQSLDGFVATVGTTYQTIDNMKGYYTKEETNSKIEQSSESITSTVNAYTDMSALGVQTGNLIVNSEKAVTTEDKEYIWEAKHPLTDNISVENGVITWNDVATLGYRSYNTNSHIKYKDIENMHLFFSLDQRADENDSSGFDYLIFELCITDNETSTDRANKYYVKRLPALTQSWTRVNIDLGIITKDKFNQGDGDPSWEEDYVAVRVHRYNSKGCQTRLWKLEIGSAATSWTPANQDIVNRVHWAESQIEQTAQSITSTVKEYTDTSVLGVQIGNLIVNSKNAITTQDKKYVWGADSSSISVEDGIITWKDISILAYRSYKTNSHIKYKDIENKRLFFSWEQRADKNTNGSDSLIFELFLTNSETSIERVSKRYIVKSSDMPVLTPLWTRVNIDLGIITQEKFSDGTVEPDWDNDYVGIKVYRYNESGCQTRLWKLEIGNMATPWSQANQDIENGIHYAESKIEQTASQIQSTVKEYVIDAQAGNLIVNSENSVTTQDGKYVWGAASSLVTVKDGIITWHDQSSQNYIAYSTNSHIKYTDIEDKHLIFSLDQRADENMSDKDYLIFELFLASDETTITRSSKYYTKKIEQLPTSTWARASVDLGKISKSNFSNGTGTPSWSTDYVGIRVHRYSTKGCQTKLWQLEIGDQATDWKPANKDLDNRVTWAESSITQNADKIAFVVTENKDTSELTITPNAINIIADNIDLTGKVTFNSLSNDMQSKVIGRNLLRYADLNRFTENKDKFRYSSETDKSRITVSNGRMTIPANSGGAQVYCYPHISYQSDLSDILKAGTKVTVSCYVYQNTLDGTTYPFGVYLGANYAATPTTTSWTLYYTPPKYKTGKISYTFTLPADVAKITLDVQPRSGATSGSITFGDLKVELGDYATDWSTAPEDDSVYNIYSTDTTTIDGGKITTGSITADKIIIGIGGTNLIQHSYDLNDYIIGVGVDGTSAFSFDKGLQVAGDGKSTLPSGAYNIAIINEEGKGVYINKSLYLDKLQDGKKYTFSCYVSKKSSSSLQIICEFMNNAHKEITRTDEGWEKVVITGTYNAKATYKSICFYAYNSHVLAGDRIRISSCMLTQGEVDIPWSLAQEDISVDNIYSPGTTTIDGGKITTGSIKADAIEAGAITANKLQVTYGGRNLLHNTQGSITVNKNTTNYQATSFVVDNPDELRGKTITFSYYRYRPAGDYVNIIDTSLAGRFGGHCTLTYKNNDGTSTTTYPLTDYLYVNTLSTDKVSMSYSLPNKEITRLAFNFQASSKPASNNNSTWILKEFQVEVGDIATAYAPAPEDISVDNIYSPGTTTIDGGKITTGSIKADAIEANSITATQIKAGTITATQIKTGTITADQIAGATITNAKLVNSTITAAKLDMTDIFTQNITATNMNITGGSIKVTTASDTTDVINLNHDGKSTSLTAHGIQFNNTSGGGTKTLLNEVGMFGTLGSYKTFDLFPNILRFYSSSNKVGTEFSNDGLTIYNNNGDKSYTISLTNRAYTKATVTTSHGRTTSGSLSFTIPSGITRCLILISRYGDLRAGNETSIAYLVTDLSTASDSIYIGSFNGTSTATTYSNKVSYEIASGKLNISISNYATGFPYNYQLLWMP